jgi:hypothetical protein
LHGCRNLRLESGPESFHSMVELRFRHVVFIIRAHLRNLWFQMHFLA